MGVKFKSKDALKNIQAKFDSFLKDERSVKRIASILVNDLKDTYTKGKDPDGVATKRIGDKWDKRRKRLSTVNQTSKYFDPSTKNSTLSFTGKFIQSLSSTYEMGTKTLFIIQAKGMHTRYRGIKGKPIGKAISNAKLMAYLSEWYGRTLVRVSQKSKSKITKIFTEYLRRKR